MKAFEIKYYLEKQLKKKQLADITVRGYFRREVLLIKRFWRIE